MNKKMNALNLMILTTTLSLTAPLTLCSAQAASDLTGQTMNCKLQPDGTHNTYQFIKGPKGNDEVIYYQDDLASTPEVFPYTVVNGSLSISLNDSNAVYDISKPADIERSFQSCVFPGEPDGDSRATCSTSVEICSLN